MDSRHSLADLFVGDAKFLLLCHGYYIPEPTSLLTFMEDAHTAFIMCGFGAEQALCEEQTGEGSAAQALGIKANWAAEGSCG